MSNAGFEEDFTTFIDTGVSLRKVQWIDTKAAAERAGLKHPSVYGLIKSKKIRARVNKKSGLYEVAMQDIEKYNRRPDNLRRYTTPAKATKVARAPRVSKELALSGEPVQTLSVATLAAVLTSARKGTPEKAQALLRCYQVGAMEPEEVLDRLCKLFGLD